MTTTAHIQKFFTSRDNRDNPDTFVGQEGRLWYDPDTNTIRIYTGDPGGMAVGSGGGGNGSPGGFTGTVQFNDNGQFGGDAGLIYNKITDTLTAGRFAGNASGLFSIPGPNVANAVPEANHAIYSDIILVGNQPLITQVGTLVNLTTSGNIYANSGTVYANAFVGDGSQLTNVQAAAGSYIVNGNSNVAVLSSGNVTFKVANVANVVQITSTGLVVNSSANSNLGDVATANTMSLTGGQLTLNIGTISTSGTQGGIFNTGISNINFGLVANITMGSTTGNVTVRNNLNANTVTATGYICNKAAVPVDLNTVIDSFPKTQYRSVKYTMRVGADEGFQTSEILLVHNGINSITTIYGSLSTTGDDLAMFDSVIVGNNVQLLATSLSTNTTVNYVGTYVTD
jgi:hypothetical protein